MQRLDKLFNDTMQREVWPVPEIDSLIYLAFLQSH